MASSPTDPAKQSPTAFAMREVTTCWHQAYEALCRGDLDSVQALLDEVDLQLPATGDASTDGVDERTQRAAMQQAFGLLQSGMQTGLDGIAGELAQARRGGKALRGYRRDY
jgi:hypothetical protein